LEPPKKSSTYLSGYASGFFVASALFRHNSQNAHYGIFFHHPASLMVCIKLGEEGCLKIEGLRGIEWVELAFPDVNIARARKRERTRRSVVTRPEGKV
jgi:hypothetical protein